MGILRVLLALIVVVHHIGHALDGNPSFPSLMRWLDGMVCVLIFYIFSGFYMSLVINEKYANGPNFPYSFYLSRVLRIFPLYWLVLFLCYVYCITSGDLGNVGNIRNLHGFDRFAQIFMNITTLGLDLVPSLGGYTFQLIGPAWSLGSELLFYLLAPWLVRLNWRRTTVLVLVVFAIRLVLFKAGYDRYPFRVLFFPFSLGFFMLGHGAYLVLNRIESMPFFRSDTVRRWVSVLSVAAILGSGAILEVGRGIDPDTPNLWAFYLIVAFLLPTTFMGSRNSAIDRFLGNLSFPLYISHYLVLTFVSDYVTGSQNARRIIALGLAILFALLLTVAIELPIEKARAKVNAWVMKNRWPRLFWHDTSSNPIPIETERGMNDAHNPQVTTDSASSAFSLPAFLHTLRGTAWLGLLVIPPALVLLWHLRNRGWPSDDSANMMATAYQQYLVFGQSGALHGLQALYAVRGWRPIALPPLAVPFLLLFHGNILAAGSAVLSLAYAGWVAYVFAIARRYLPRLQAAAATAATVSFPAFVVYDLIFNTEGAWLFAAFGWLYHSLAAEDFRRKRHAALAGLLLGLAVMLRPAETSLMVAVPFCYLAAKARHGTPWQHIILGFALLGILAAALIASAFVAGLDRDKLLVIGEAAIILWLLALRGELGGFSIFCGTMGVCVLGWWAGFMPALYGWVYTTSFGPMAHATALFQGASLWTKLYETFSVYFGWQSLVIAVLGCAMILWHWLNRAIKPAPDARSASPVALGALAAAMLAPLVIVYAMTGTTDSRRAIVGVAAALLTFAIAALRTGGALRVRTTIVLVAACINGFALVTAMLPDLVAPGAVTDAFKLYLPAARLTPDADPALISALNAAGVPPTSNVAVYTLALFYAQARVYEPAELELAAQVDGQGSYQIGYLWDEGDYAGVLHRLYAMNYRYLVLDLYPGPGWPVAQNPYVEFTTHLLGIYKNGAGISPGLKRMQTLQLGGRAHELFKIEPQ